MKPTKNQIYCKDCGKHKMVFETEKKADTFIKFNSKEIESESGYSPTRSYFCIYCGGYHVTSKSEIKNFISKTEKIVDNYEQNNLKWALIKEKNIEIRKNAQIKFLQQLVKLEEQIKVIDSYIDSNNLVDLSKHITELFAELETVKKTNGYSRRKKIIELNLNDLQMKIDLKDNKKVDL